MVVEIGGDWKWLRQCFRFTGHWASSTDVCHYCRVGKDYVDLAPPSWYDTNTFIANLPAHRTTPLILLPHFHMQMISVCQLHVLNLGLLWTANGSTLLYLIEQGLFGDPSSDLAELLDASHHDFIYWTAKHRARHSQRQFNVNLVVKKSGGAYLTARGHNSQIICEWLASCALSAWKWDPMEDLNGRIFGHWLLSQGRQPVQDDMLAPTAEAMLLGFSPDLSCSFFFAQFH